ncbi:ATP-dependent DNA helicase PIF1 [Eumeta japonica]|uniref:ATP-dependent DNA helicase PIF1 n=1 Tax=Eumeta variegata TaxID=151549 RepID=A0A4C1XIF5_EUMVA|nr:ATP-dependent DNA helicase PIF1 [Eumeta japonica]
MEQPEIKLNSIDEIDCPRYLNKRAKEVLKKNEGDSSLTAGLENVITIKLGARVILHRNIDVSKGLVNGSIGVIEKINWDVDRNSSARKIVIKFNNLTYELERVKTKFQILNDVYVHREQFPICLAYVITIHKSQGLSLDSALLDIGTSIFSRGQAYVALSRVKTLDGVHLINLDPSQMKAQDSSILEYNRLRSLYRLDFANISINRKRIKNVANNEWAMRTIISNIQENVDNSIKKTMQRKRKKKTLNLNACLVFFTKSNDISPKI